MEKIKHWNKLALKSSNMFQCFVFSSNHAVRKYQKFTMSKIRKEYTAYHSPYTVWNPFPMISLVLEIKINASGVFSRIKFRRSIAWCLFIAVRTMYLSFPEKAPFAWIIEALRCNSCLMKSIKQNKSYMFEAYNFLFLFMHLHTFFDVFV